MSKTLQSCTNPEIEFLFKHFLRKCFKYVDHPSYLELLTKLNKVTTEYCRRRYDQKVGVNWKHMQIFREKYLK